MCARARVCVCVCVSERGGGRTDTPFSTLSSTLPPDAHYRKCRNEDAVTSLNRNTHFKHNSSQSHKN